jgi:tetratricopeptide (TPR) repeat protein
VLPLQAAEAEALLDQAGPGRLPAEVRSIVLQRTAGNPFFIAEVARNLRDGKADSVPLTVQEVLAARVDRLLPGDRKAAQRASVIGREFIVRLLARISAEPVEPSLAALEAASLIVEGGLIPERRYSFRHALMHEVIYQGQLLSQRRKLHGQVGVAIEELYAGRTEEWVGLLAFHYAHSDNDQKALHWLVKAADRARGLFANDEAIASYHEALTRARDGEGPLDAGTIHERIGDVLLLSGRYDDAISSFDAAEAHQPDPARGTMARLHRKRGSALRVKGEYDLALQAFSQAQHALAGGRHVEAARVGVEEGALHWRRGSFEQARAALGEAVEIGERLGAEEVVADGLMQLGNVWFSTGLAESVAFYQRARDLYERLQNLPGLTTARTNLGGAFVRMGRWDDGLREMRESLVSAERMGNPWSIGRCQNNIGEVHLMRGELEAAIESFQRAIEIWEPIGYASGVAIALIGVGAARAQSGDIDRGRADLLGARDRFAALGSTTYLPELYRHLASAELAAGDLVAAESAANLSIEYSRKAGAAHFEAIANRVLGEIALERGDREAAVSLLEASRRGLEGLGEAAELSRTEEVLSRVYLKA